MNTPILTENLQHVGAQNTAFTQKLIQPIAMSKWMRNVIVDQMKQNSANRMNRKKRIK